MKVSLLQAPTVGVNFAELAIKNKSAYVHHAIRSLTFSTKVGFPSSGPFGLMENADDDVRGALLPMAIEDTTTPSGKHPESWVTQLRKAMDAHARSLAICLGLGGLSLMVFLVIFRGPPSFSKHDHPENEIGEGDAIGDSIPWQQRAEAVKQAFVHAYSNYEKFAYPMDELKPLSKHGVNKWVMLLATSAE